MKKLSLPELDRVQLRILPSFEQESRSRVPDLRKMIFVVVVVVTHSS